MSNQLIGVLARFSKELEARNLRYALIGGLAASIRGRVRATEDVDLILMCSLDQALDFVESLRQSDFAPLIDNYQEIARSALLIPVVQQTSGTQLDLAIGLSGFEHEIVERADPMMINDVEIFVATAEDLLLLKLLAGRPQDLQDIEGIVEIQSDRIDWQYCVETAKRLEAAVSIDLVERLEKLRC